MHEAGQGEVMYEARAAKHLVGKIEPRHRGAGEAPGRRQLRRHARRRIALEQRGIGKLPITGAQIARSDDRAVFDRKVVAGDAQPLRGAGKIDGARLGGGMAHGGTRLLHREGARGGALVGACRRGHRQHADAADVDVELVGGNLCQGGGDALADFDLAWAHLDKAAGIEPEPARQARVGGEVDRQLGGHGTSSWAARSTARTMRLWAPHRHRLRSSAPRTCASLGLGSRARRAAADIRMPAMQ